MKHKIINLRHELSDAVVQKMADDHQPASERDYDYIVTDFATVLKPNGEVLLKLLPWAVDPSYTEAAFNSFHGNLYDKKGSYRAAIKKSQNAGSEGVFGSMEAAYPFTYCRTTALTVKHLEEFRQAYPFIRSAAKLMEQHLPERYAAQLRACEDVKGLHHS